jgi:antitoxin (DNA-binding transcriptional repressor) of toxin-antitoxin stability system
MEATFVELRTKSNEILQALERNEPVTILYRGQPKAVMQPLGEPRPPIGKARDHGAFGLWKDRKDLPDAAQQVRDIRRGRHSAL